MKYNQYTNNSKYWIKRISHNARFKVAIKLCTSGDAGKVSILDYGTGAAHFLKMLSGGGRAQKLVGFEPAQKMFELAKSETAGFDDIQVVNTLDGLKNEFDYVTCLEVLEHLKEEDQQAAVSNCFSLLKEGGQLIISVPIETGLASLLKNTARAVISQTHTKSFKDIMKAAFGMKIERDFSNGYCHSHTGFRHKDLEKILKRNGYYIKRRIYSPNPALLSYINSQVFYVLTKRQA